MAINVVVTGAFRYLGGGITKFASSLRKLFKAWAAKEGGMVMKEVERLLQQDAKSLSAEEKKLIAAVADLKKALEKGVGEEQAKALQKEAEEAYEELKGVEGHHLATNENWVSTLRGGPWSPRFAKIFARAGMTLEDAENLVDIPGHYGPHSEAYHQCIYNARV